MNCCQCQGIERLFNQQETAKKLKQYRRKGPDKTTRLLIEALKAQDVAGMTLLDIGGGIGAIQHGLLKAGVTSATSIEASSAYLEAAQAEAERQGHAACITHYHGNFVDLAANISPADIVTLDRVICCYHDMPGLVTLSSMRAARLYGLVYPRDVWWVRLGLSLMNFLLRLRRNPFRVFVHSPEAVESIIQANGLQRCFYRTAGVWQVVVYTR
ncbi:MAG: class I SAM-dependent methyltransferase [Chloroflexota bacterium]